VPHLWPPRDARGDPLRQLLEHAAAVQLKYPRDAGFHRELKRRVSDHFRRAGHSQRDSPRMIGKTAVLLLWFGASYALLVFAAATWWQGLLLSSSLALAMAGVGFAIQHDANHGAYSRHQSVNRLMGMTLDLMGASSYLWHWKHNISHHTYPNLSGADDDIDLSPICRMSPAQPRGADLVQLIGGKALFFGCSCSMPRWRPEPTADRWCRRCAPSSGSATPPTIGLSTPSGRTGGGFAAWGVRSAQTR